MNQRAYQNLERISVSTSLLVILQGPFHSAFKKLILATSASSNNAQKNGILTSISLCNNSITSAHDIFNRRADTSALEYRHSPTLGQATTEALRAQAGREDIDSNARHAQGAYAPGLQVALDGREMASREMARSANRACEFSANVHRGMSASSACAHAGHEARCGCPYRTGKGAGSAEGLFELPTGVGIGRKRGNDMTEVAYLKYALQEIERRVTDIEENGASRPILKAIVSDAHQLTESVNRITDLRSSSLAMRIYEAAVDAALLAEDLPFFITCTKRLIDLYEEMKQGTVFSTGYADFLSYGLLYFGVVQDDEMQITRLVELTRANGSLSKEPVRSVLSMLKAVRQAKELRFITLWKRATVQQKFIVRSLLPGLQERAICKLVRTHKRLDHVLMSGMLGLDSPEQVSALLRKACPGLLSEGPCSEFASRREFKSKK